MNDIYESHIERHSSCLLLNTYIKAENQLVKTSVCVSLEVDAFLLCDWLRHVPPGVLQDVGVTSSVSPSVFFH